MLHLLIAALRGYYHQCGPKGGAHDKSSYQLNSTQDEKIIYNQQEVCW